MKWFKHDTDARQDFKLKRLVRRFGMEGYGMYWSVVELLAFETKDQIEGDVRLSLDNYPIEDISHDLNIEPSKAQLVLDFMAETGLIDPELYESKVLCCKALAKRSDEYTVKRRRVRTKSGQSPENVPLEEKRREEIKKRREEITVAWNATTLPKIINWSDERREKLSARMKSAHFNEHWKSAVDKLGKSPFATGSNDRNWKASIDWFLANDNNYVKVLEGKYDGQETKDRFAKY